MKNKAIIEILVGMLMLLGALALAFLALKVSGLAVNGDMFGNNSYKISADFNNIGTLKARSPVRIGGVEVGTVSTIKLNPTTFQAQVTMKIKGNINQIPSDTSARIASSGLLGDNYISLLPGYSEQSLKNGSIIHTTYSATSIVNLLSTFAGSFKTKQSNNNTENNSTIGAPK